jgi:hypothetical protein
VGRAQRSEFGGIQSLLTLPQAQWEALEADLVHAGFAWSDVPQRLSWRGVHLFARHARQDSAFYMANADEDTQWPRLDQLITVLIDAVNSLTWVTQAINSDEGHRPARPQPFPRPGVTPVEDPDSQHYGHDPIPAQDFDVWWSTGQISNN